MKRREGLLEGQDDLTVTVYKTNDRLFDFGAGAYKNLLSETYTVMIWTIDELEDIIQERAMERMSGSGVA